MEALGTELNGHKAWKHRTNLASVPTCSKRIEGGTDGKKCGIAICDNNYSYNRTAVTQHNIYYHMNIDNLPNHEIFRKITTFEDEDHGGWKRSEQLTIDYHRY